MTLRNDWLVRSGDARPAGQPDECFYCKARMGESHRMGCVTRSRTVVVRTTIEHVISVPEDWGVSTIEFTEGSACQDSFADDLAAMVERLNERGDCLCGFLSREYVREASEQDEAEYPSTTGAKAQDAPPAPERP